MGGGRQNTANGFGATVGGGYYNTAGNLNATYATISGGWVNTASQLYSTVGGGQLNTAGNQYATVAGGGGNTANGEAAAVGGGINNFLAPLASTIAGGSANRIAAFADWAAIGGGSTNVIGTNALHATVSGGRENQVGQSAMHSTISGGRANRVGLSANDATIGGGRFNEIQLDALGATIAGGDGNTVLVDGRYATIPGGTENRAGRYGFAAGRRAKADHEGAFVWADSANADFASTANNQFLVRASGGVGINTTTPQAPLHVWGRAIVNGADQWDVNNTEGDFRVGSATHRFKIGVAQGGGGAGDVWMRAHGGTARLFLKTPGGTTIYSNEGQTTGVTLASGGGAWTSVSDRNAKENFAPVDPQEVLEKVAALPLSSWNYKSQDASIRHVGPMAQDFKAAFGLGESETGITTVDADGVALAAIQGLNHKVESGNADGKAGSGERGVENPPRKT